MEQVFTRKKKKLSCLDMAVSEQTAKIEGKFEVLPLRKQSTD
jgi:hypothetical protein